MKIFAGRTLRVIMDLLILGIAFGVAYLLRFEGVPTGLVAKHLLFSWPYVVGLQYLVLIAFGVPRFAWRYVGLREAGRIWVAIGVATLILLGVRLLAGVLVNYAEFLHYAIVPAGVILIDFACAFLGVTGVRAARRLLGERAQVRAERRRDAEMVPTFLIGAGQAGVQVAREIAAHPHLGIKVVGFLDDDRQKVGTVIEGIRVVGTTDDVEALAQRFGATQAVITIANAHGSEIRRINERCRAAGMPAKIVPGVFEILDGKVSLSRIREVSIEDLLRREPVRLDSELVRGFLAGKRVIVTGAGGSIGSELCRQVARFRPACIVLAERSEYLLFLIHRELTETHPDLDIQARIADVCDGERLENVFDEFMPQVVFHAAAHKHVPMMEWNAGEAIKNNVFGTKTLAEVTHRKGAEAFVLISTDKAVNPTSVMGATKRVAEMVVQAMSVRSSTKFIAVRFGNVLGSNGSVIPVFQRQIAAGGPVTVTHPDMLRYFMTIPEASQLVMQAAAMGKSGQVLVLDMGEPVRIVDLAKDLIRLSGFEPGDIRIEFVGIRDGEKLFEEIGFDSERMTKTEHSKIYQGRLAPCTWEQAQAALDALARFTGAASTADVRAALRLVVPEMAAEPCDPKESMPVDRARAAEAPSASAVKRADAVRRADG